MLSDSWIRSILCRIYYNVRGWGWFQFYTTVKGEMGKILAKMAEDARKKAMAEGLAKIEGMLAGRIADREAVEGINADLAGKKAGLAATIEGNERWAGTSRLPPHAYHLRPTTSGLPRHA